METGEEGLREACSGRVCVRSSAGCVPALGSQALVQLAWPLLVLLGVPGGEGPSRRGLEKRKPGADGVLGPGRPQPSAACLSGNRRERRGPLESDALPVRVQVGRQPGLRLCLSPVGKVQKVEQLSRVVASRCQSRRFVRPRLASKRSEVYAWKRLGSRLRSWPTVDRCCCRTRSPPPTPRGGTVSSAGQVASGLEGLGSKAPGEEGQGVWTGGRGRSLPAEVGPAATTACLSDRAPPFVCRRCGSLAWGNVRVPPTERNANAAFPPALVSAGN